MLIIRLYSSAYSNFFSHLALILEVAEFYRRSSLLVPRYSWF